MDTPLSPDQNRLLAAAARLNSSTLAPHLGLVAIPLGEVFV